MAFGSIKAGYALSLVPGTAWTPRTARTLRCPGPDPLGFSWWSQHPEFREVATTVSFAQEHEQFFAVLDKVKSITLAARELGINRNTAYGWARKAGVCHNSFSSLGVATTP